MYHHLRGTGSAQGPSQTTAILGTTDGGRRWRRSAPLPVTPFGDYLSYEPYFTDAQHGWLYGMAWTVPGDLVWQVVERLWRTSDGGATWSPVTLAAPPQGWPAATETYDGVPVGMPRIVGSELLVAVGDRYFRPSLDIEASSDGGQSWHLASRVSSLFASPSTFQPVDASHWVVYAPGGLMQTSDAGRTWQAVGEGAAVTGGPFWFTSPARGYARAPDGTVLSTADAGRTWTAGAAPPGKLPASGPAVSSLSGLSPMPRAARPASPAVRVALGTTRATGPDGRPTS